MLNKKGQTVQQFLESIKGDYKQVKIGSKDGTGFTYCGPIDFEEIVKEGAYVRNKTLEAIDRAVSNFSNIDINMPSYIEKAVIRELNGIDVKEAGDPKEFRQNVINSAKIAAQDAIDRYVKSSQGKLATINNYFDRLNPWVDIMNREVVETYPSIESKSTLIILCKGFEAGEYWDEGEYRKAHAEREAQYRKAYYQRTKGEKR